ncbi:MULTISPECIES: MarR family transcriptional regulator [Arthrobacter]|uniref:MarR family transcriptional regulator n=2 Tax=Arthrobacter TaxID=1663 RepID=A0ABU9KK58_9MICC|nr:MarR family transcriptional regulator [Arthrobacter sp. YJM1]MDP5227043.1 MarR family transcriptional regulator [Arthrobacter sp. YJM1]
MSTSEPEPLVEQWRSVQNCYLKTSNALDRELSSHFGIGLNDFETLDLLAEYGDSECRMKDLTQVSPMTQSALSKIVDRLEKGGYVHRSACSTDRRSLVVGLTDSGVKLHDDAAKIHRDVLQNTLMASAHPA